MKDVNKYKNLKKQHPAKSVTYKQCCSSICEINSKRSNVTRMQGGSECVWLTDICPFFWCNNHAQKKANKRSRHGTRITITILYLLKWLIASSYQWITVCALWLTRPVGCCETKKKTNKQNRTVCAETDLNLWPYAWQQIHAVQLCFILMLPAPMQVCTDIQTTKSLILWIYANTHTDW